MIDLNGDGNGTTADLLIVVEEFLNSGTAFSTVGEILEVFTNENDLRCHVSFVG